MQLGLCGISACRGWKGMGAAWGCLGGKNGAVLVGQGWGLAAVPSCGVQRFLVGFGRRMLPRRRASPRPRASSLLAADMLRELAVGSVSAAAQPVYLDRVTACEGKVPGPVCSAGTCLQGQVAALRLSPCASLHVLVLSWLPEHQEHPHVLCSVVPQPGTGPQRGDPAIIPQPLSRGWFGAVAGSQGSLWLSTGHRVPAR